MTIRRTLLLAFLLTSLLPAIVLAALAFSRTRALMQQEIELNLRNRVQAVSSGIDRMLFERLQNAVTWNHLQVMQDLRIGDLDKRLSGFLAEVVQRYGGVYRTVDAVTADGRIVASSDAARIGSILPDSAPWLQARLPGGEVSIRGPQRDRPDGPASLQIRTLIASQFGAADTPPAAIGELVLRFDWSQVERLLDQAAEDRRGVLIVDDGGRVVAASSRLAPRAGAAALSDWLRQAGEETAVLERDGAPLVDGEVIVAISHSQGFSHFAGFGWTTMIVQPLDEALRPVHRMALAFGSIVVVIGAASVLLSLLVASRLSRPITALTDYTRGFVREARAPSPPPAAGGEIGRLRDTFVRMVEDLARSRDALVRASKLAVLGEMSAVMAHEVRTPLGIVRSSAQVLQREPGISAEGRELLDFISSETERLNRLLSSMLDSTRGRPLQLATTDLAELIRKTVDLLQVQIDQRSLRVELRLPDDLPPLDCDAEQLSQALLNLLMNAIEILPPGGCIEISARPEGRYLCVEVADDGPGIPPGERERIFDPFVFKREGGTGLGLAVVRQIVEAHAGRIVVLDAPQGGALFRLSLPLEAIRS